SGCYSALPCCLVLSGEQIRQALEHGNDKVTPAAPPCLHLILLGGLTRRMLMPSPALAPVSRGAASLGPGVLRLGRVEYHKPSIVTTLFGGNCIGCCRTPDNTQAGSRGGEVPLSASA